MESVKIFHRYCIGASLYGSTRKIIVLRKHKVETINYNYEHKEYRNVLATEMVPLSIVSGLLGTYTFPFHLFNDVKYCEVKLRKLNDAHYKSESDYNHSSLDDLLFV